VPTHAPVVDGYSDFGLKPTLIVIEESGAISIV
jgi:hypothetical protein